MQQLRIGDIVRITQPLYARLYTRWYDTREQRLITNSVGKMAQVRSVYKYNGQYRYRLRIEGMRSHTRYGFEMSEIEYVSQPPEPFPKHMFEPGEKVVVSTGNPVTDRQPRRVVERVTYFSQFGDIRYRLDHSTKYYTYKQLTTIDAPSLNYTLF